MYLPCNTSQYIIEVLGCITGCIGMYSQMYWDVFVEVFWFMCRMGIHPNTAGNTSQYIVEYIIIPLKYIPIHLWCIEMLIHPKNIWYIQNTSKYIPIHRVHPPRFANGTLLNTWQYSDEKPQDGSLQQTRSQLESLSKNVALNSRRPHRFGLV